MFNKKKNLDSKIRICNRCGFVNEMIFSKKKCSQCGFGFFKIADRSGTPQIDQPFGDDKGKRNNPYRKNDPLKGEGYNLTDFGENDAVGGGNTIQPATTDGVSVDPRTTEDNYGNPQSMPNDSTILENEDGGKNIPSTDAWKNFMTEESPLHPINNDSKLDENTFQTSLNKRLTFNNGSSDIVNRAKKRRKSLN